MKVQYTSDFFDGHMAFKKGWTAEHTDPEALRRIALGVCVEVTPEARARRLEIVVTECVTPDLTAMMVGAAIADARRSWGDDETHQDKKQTNTNKK